MRIGEVAAQAGVNTQTLRYYERRRLLPEPDRSASGYREYDNGVAQLVRFIKRAQELGFTLREIAELIELRERAPRPDAKVRGLAAAKIDDINSRIRQLTAMRGALQGLVEACACEADAATCPIIEALEDSTHGAQTGALAGKE